MQSDADSEPFNLFENSHRVSSVHAMRIREDCRFYRGDIPCGKKKVCWECDEFEPIPRRALIVKFGAPGDALRTTPVLQKLRDDGFGEITWICDKPSTEVLSQARNIDRLVPYGPEALSIAMVERFETVFSLDKDPAAASLATLANSDDKRGFTINESGRLTVFDDRSRYALRLGIDDALKFRENKMTVPALMYQMSGYEYAGQEYELDYDKLPAPEVPCVTLNVGVGPRWPTKAYPSEQWIELARLLLNAGYDACFAGGPAESEAVRDLARLSGARAYEAAPLRTFAGRLAASAAVVTCDSLALHVALAVKTKVVGLFCATTPSEIEWFGRGKALTAAPGPCYDSQCARWPGCIGEISPASIFETVRSLIG